MLGRSSRGFGRGSLPSISARFSLQTQLLDMRTGSEGRDGRKSIDEGQEERLCGLWGVYRQVGQVES